MYALLDGRTAIDTLVLEIAVIDDNKKTGRWQSREHTGIAASSHRIHGSTEANVEDDDQTKALLAILKLGEIEIREGRFRDADKFLAELEKEDDGDGPDGE